MLQAKGSLKAQWSLTCHFIKLSSRWSHVTWILYPNPNDDWPGVIPDPKIIADLRWSHWSAVISDPIVIINHRWLLVCYDLWLAISKWVTQAMRTFMILLPAISFWLTWRMIFWPMRIMFIMMITSCRDLWPKWLTWRWSRVAWGLCPSWWSLPAVISGLNNWPDDDLVSHEDYVHHDDHFLPWSLA